MKNDSPAPNLFDINQLRKTGTRTVEVTVNDVPLRVTHRIAKDPGIETEILTMQMKVSDDARESAAIQFKIEALPEGPSPERERLTDELDKVNTRTDRLYIEVTLNPRRAICKQIAADFTAWNANLPLDFEALLASPLETATLQEIYAVVVNEPIVGKQN